MSKTLMWTAGVCQPKHLAAESLQVGPPLSMLAGASMALIVDPALLRNNTDFNTVLQTLTQGVHSSKDRINLEQVPLGPFIEALASHLRALAVQLNAAPAAKDIP